MIKNIISLYKSSTTTELICSASVVVILIIGVVIDEPIRNVMAAALVPATIGLIHRSISIYRSKQ